MNSIQIFAVIRQLMTMAGVYIVSTGVVTASQFDTISGSLLTLASVGWSIYASRKDVLVSKVANLPEVESVTVTSEKLADKVDRDNVSSR